MRPAIEVLRWRVEQYTVDGWVEMATTPVWGDARDLMLYLRREGARGARILDLTRGPSDDQRAVLTILGGWS